MFGRKARTPPEPLPLALPRLDGVGWPDPAAVGRPSFDAATYHDLAVRHALDPEAHAAGDRLIDAVLHRVPTGGAAEDAPHLRKVFLTAARIGAGVAIVERGLTAPRPGTVERGIAGALLQARRGLPAMQPDWAAVAGFFLLAGFHVVRSGPAVLDQLLADLG